MQGTSRITISLPTGLLEAVDNELKGEESRSAAIRRLLEDALRKSQEQREIERYIRGYREDPQTEAELGWSDVATCEHLSELPWK